MAGILDFLTGAAQGVGESLQKRQEQQMKLQQISAQAKAKQTGRGATDMLAEVRLMQELGLMPKQRIPRPTPSNLTTAISDTANAVARLQELEGYVQQNPEVQTGPAELRLKRTGIGGTLGNLGLQYGTAPAQAKKITELSRMANQTQDIYRRAVTGAQAGFPEIKFLQTSIASPERETRDNYITSLRVTRNETQQRLRQMIDAVDSAGYDSTEFRQRFAPFMAQSQTDNAGQSFVSEQEAEAAHLPVGTIVTINGRRARIQ